MIRFFFPVLASLLLLSTSVFAQSYTIRAKSNKRGRVVPRKAIVESGASKLFQFKAKRGFYAKDVIVNGESKGSLTSYLFENVTQNSTLRVKFAPLFHTITASLRTPHGKLRKNGTFKVRDGKNKVFIVKPKSGYRAGLLVDGYLVKYSNKIGKKLKYKIKKIKADLTVEAIFAYGNESFVDSLSINLTGLGNAIRVTNQNPAKFTGLASSDLTIKQVKWLNSSIGESGVATGIEEWEAMVKLATGDNKLIFTVVGADDTTRVFDTLVNYHKDLAFTTVLKSNYLTVFTGEPEKVRFEVGIDSSTLSDKANVNIHRVSKTGEVHSDGYDMYDNGKLPDEIGGDGIFTTEITVGSEVEELLYYRALVVIPYEDLKPTISYRSELISIWVTKHLTVDDINTSTYLANTVKEKYNQLVAQGQTVEQAKSSVVAWLSADPNVGRAGAKKRTGIWWVTKRGLLGSFSPPFAGQKGGSGGRETSVVSQQSIPVEKVKSQPMQYYSSDVSSLTESIASENFARSRRGIIISPYIENPKTEDGKDFGLSDDLYGPWTVIQDNQIECSMRSSAELVNNKSSKVSLESFETLSRFGIIHISTHGGNYFTDLYDLWDENWGPADSFKGMESVITLDTGTVIPKEDGVWDFSDIERDLLEKRLSISVDGVLELLPAYFHRHLEPLPNSVVILSSCKSAANNSMASMLLSKGAGVVVGFTDYVTSSYAGNIAKKIYTDMLAGLNVGEAFNNAVSLYGANDGKADYTGYAKLIGRGKDLELPFGAGLFNGSFEEESMAPWSARGDGRIIRELGANKPTDGTKMAIVSTGLGYATVAGILSQDICLTDAVSSISFDWNYFSEEFLEYCNSQYQDSFDIYMCDIDFDSGEEVCEIVFRKIVDDLCDEVVKSDLHFDQGENGDVYKTGWRRTVLPLTKYTGTQTTLKFAAGDVGDSIFDSAVLIDDIKAE